MTSEEESLAAVRRALIGVAAHGGTITYRDLALKAGVPSPQTIHKTTMALETLTREDDAAGRPLLAAVAVGKVGIPRPGFFRLLGELGRYEGPDEGPQAQAHHAYELAAVHEAWRQTNGQPA